MLHRARRSYNVSCARATSERRWNERTRRDGTGRDGMGQVDMCERSGAPAGDFDARLSDASVVALRRRVGITFFSSRRFSFSRNVPADIVYTRVISKERYIKEICVFLSESFTYTKPLNVIEYNFKEYLMTSVFVLDIFRKTVFFLYVSTEIDFFGFQMFRGIAFFLASNAIRVSFLRY